MGDGSHLTATVRERAALAVLAGMPIVNVGGHTVLIGEQCCDGSPGIARMVEPHCVKRREVGVRASWRNLPNTNFARKFVRRHGVRV